MSRSLSMEERDREIVKKYHSYTRWPNPMEKKKAIKNVAADMQMSPKTVRAIITRWGKR